MSSSAIAPPGTSAAREAQIGEHVLVAVVLGGGRSIDAIAAALVISPRTLLQHLKAIPEKLGVRSRRALAARAADDHAAPRTPGGTSVP